jgi:hypothetical protein
VVARNVGSGTINLRIALASADDVDDEVVDWLAKAYRQSIVPPASKPRAPRRQLGDLTSMSVVVEGHDLPGLHCHPGPEGGHDAVHVGLWTSPKDASGVAVHGRPLWVTDVMPGDAPSVRWECTVTVGRDADGPDFVGPHVRGGRTDRHLGLFWGDFDGAEFRMFRRCQAPARRHHPRGHRRRGATGTPLVGRLGLTDAKGLPVCARRHDIQWSAVPV